MYVHCTFFSVNTVDLMVIVFCLNLWLGYITFRILLPIIMASEATPVDCPTVILATDKQTLHNFSEPAWGRSYMYALYALRLVTLCVIRNLITVIHTF